MQGISAPDILWHTNVLLAILCDTKKSVRHWGPFQPIAAHCFLCRTVPYKQVLRRCIGFFCVHFTRHRFGIAYGSGFCEWHRKAPDLASGEQFQSRAQIFLALLHLRVVYLE